MLFKQSGRDDGVGDARFIFQAEECEALGGGGSLTADDAAGDTDDGVIAGLGEVDGAPDSLASKFGTVMGDGVLAHGHRSAGEVGDQPLGYGHGLKRRFSVGWF